MDKALSWYCHAKVAQEPTCGSVQQGHPLKSRDIKFSWIRLSVRWACPLAEEFVAVCVAACMIAHCLLLLMIILQLLQMTGPDGKVCYYYNGDPRTIYERLVSAHSTTVL